MVNFHKIMSQFLFKDFSSSCMKNRHSGFWLYKLLSLHYVHKLTHSTIIAVLQLSHKYLNISLGNEVGIGVTYFAGWCWSRPGCCNGRNQPPFGHGPVPRKAYRPWDLQCGRCSAGQSWCGQWPHPDPAETKTVSDENNPIHHHHHHHLPLMPNQSNHTGEGKNTEKKWEREMKRGRLQPVC